MTLTGDAIRAIREAQSLSLRDLSAATGLDRGYLSRVERGLVQAPDRTRVQVIADAMGVPITAIHHHRGDDVTAMATKKKAPPTAVSGGAAPKEDPSELVHYTPEQVHEAGWLPYKPRTLRDKAKYREIPHSRSGGRITFRLAHIREIAAMGDVRPISETKPSPAA